MSIRLGDVFPNFKASTTIGDITFHDWLGDSWGILFSHPADYTPVCTTELGRAANYMPKFTERGVKLIALSCDNLDSHKGWLDDIKSYCPELRNKEFPYPLIADEKRELATLLGMLDPDEKDAAGLPLTCRSLFFIGPDKKLKASIIYPASTGRSFDEVLRVVDSLQLTVKRKVATPAELEAWLCLHGSSNSDGRGGSQGVPRRCQRRRHAFREEISSYCHAQQ